MVRPRSFIALAAALLLAPLPAVAETVWLCGLSDDLLRLVCVADAPDAVAPAATAQVGATVFPLDPQRRFVVDLWGPATELPFLETLAQATICYRSPQCRAIVVAPALMPMQARRKP